LRRNDDGDGILLVDVSIIFKEEGNKSAYSGTMVFADPFG